MGTLSRCGDDDDDDEDDLVLAIVAGDTEWGGEVTKYFIRNPDIKLQFAPQGMLISTYFPRPGVKCELA